MAYLVCGILGNLVSAAVFFCNVVRFIMFTPPPHSLSCSLRVTTMPSQALSKVKPVAWCKGCKQLSSLVLPCLRNAAESRSVDGGLRPHCHRRTARLVAHSTQCCTPLFCVHLTFLAVYLECRGTCGKQLKAKNFCGQRQILRS